MSATQAPGGGGGGGADAIIEAIFAGGEQGWWYDPSDFSTMFQDLAGTVPVTAVGQQVSYMLDKSGNGNHLHCVNSGLGPTLVQHANGRYALHFNHNDSRLVSVNLINPGTTKALTLWWGQHRTNSNTGYANTLFDFRPPTSNHGFVGYSSGGGNYEEWYTVTYNWQYSMFLRNWGANNGMNVEVRATQMDMAMPQQQEFTHFRINGVQYVESGYGEIASAGNPNDLIPAKLHIGCEYSQTRMFGGYIFEMIGRLGPTSSETVLEVDDHMMDKMYGPVLKHFAYGQQGYYFDISDTTTLFQDTAGTTPVTAVGQSVARVNDKSGRGHHLLQATASKRPTYQVDGDGKHYLQFDGIDDFMETVDAIPSGGTFTSATFVHGLRRAQTTDGVGGGLLTSYPGYMGGSIQFTMDAGIAEASDDYMHTASGFCLSRHAWPDSGVPNNVRSNWILTQVVDTAGTGNAAQYPIHRVNKVEVPGSLLYEGADGALHPGAGYKMKYGAGWTGEGCMEFRLYGAFMRFGTLSLAQLEAIEDHMNTYTGAY